MLSKDTNRAVANQVQANNTQLFGGLTAVNKVTASPAIATTAAPMKIAQQSASFNQPAIINSRTSEPVMAMGAQMKPNMSTVMGQSAETVRVPNMQQATPSIQRTSNLSMYAGASVN